MSSSASMMPVNPPSSTAMLVERRALVERQRAHRRAGELEDLADAGAVAERGQREHVEHHVLRGQTPRGSRPSSSTRRLSRHGHANRAGDQGVRHVGRADAEREAAERAAMQRVRVGADDELPRQRVVLGHHRVRDAGDVAAVVDGSLGIGQRAVHAQPMALGERLLGAAHRDDVRHQAVAHMRGTLGHIGGVVLEDDDAGGILQRQRRAERRVEHVSAHAGVVLVDEAPVGAHERTVARVRRRRGELGRQGMPRDDLLEQRAGRRVIPMRIGPRTDVAHETLAETQQASALQDRGGQGVAALDELLDRYRRARLDARDQAEVGRREEPDVVGVLPVDALEALGHDEADAGQFLGRRTVLARRSFAVALAGDGHREAAVADRIDADRPFATDPESGVRITPERGVVVREDRHRRDLVGRDVVPERPDAGEGRPLARQLRRDRIRSIDEVEDAAGQVERCHPGLLTRLPCHPAGDFWNLRRMSSDAMDRSPCCRCSTGAKETTLFRGTRRSTPSAAATDLPVRAARAAPRAS